MFRLTFLIFHKDLRLTLGRSSGIAQGLLLGLLLIFVFSLSRGPGEIASVHEAAVIFWLSSVFCQILIFNQLYSLEEANNCRDCLALSPLPVQGVWLGKALTGLLLLCIAQLIFLPAVLIFLNQNIIDNYWLALLSLFLTDIGICELGSLLGAVSQGQSGKESLISIILFPLLIPLLLTAISLCSAEAGDTQAQTWLGIACAFDAVFLAAGLLLFEFVYRGGD